MRWYDAARADSYIVKRSTISGSPYTNIATGVTATSYLDSGLVNGTTYYYVVAATNVYGVSPDSTEASAAPWFSAATVAVAGHWRGGSCRQSALRQRSVHCVRGRSGHSRLGRCVPVYLHDCDRDCTIIARVVSVQNIDPWSKAGVMIRAGSGANAANAFIAVTPGNGVTWQYRLTDGDDTSWNQPPA